MMVAMVMTMMIMMVMMVMMSMMVVIMMIMLMIIMMIMMIIQPTMASCWHHFGIEFGIIMALFFKLSEVPSAADVVHYALPDS